MKTAETEYNAKYSESGTKSVAETPVDSKVAV